MEGRSVSQSTSNCYRIHEKLISSNVQLLHTTIRTRCGSLCRQCAGLPTTPNCVENLTEIHKRFGSPNWSEWIGAAFDLPAARCQLPEIFCAMISLASQRSELTTRPARRNNYQERIAKQPAPSITSLNNQGSHSRHLWSKPAGVRTVLFEPRPTASYRVDIPFSFPWCQRQMLTDRCANSTVTPF